MFLLLRYSIKHSHFVKQKEGFNTGCSLSSEVTQKVQMHRKCHLVTSHLVPL